MAHSMRFSGFKRLIEDIFNDDPRHNPPARVSRQSNSMVEKWKKTVQYVVDGVMKLMDVGRLGEARYSDVVHKVEPLIFPADCAYVCNFLRKNGVELKDGKKKWDKVKCGTEGCGYFFGDKVLKCTFGKHEWEIAGHLKGDRDLFPVIDTDMEPTTKTYLILSWKLKPGDDLDYERGAQLRTAGGLVSSFLSDRTVQYWTSPEDWEPYLELSAFETYASENHYYGNEYAKEGFKKMADRLFEVVVAIFRRSGYFVTRDLHTGNMGLDHKGEPQVFDLGYPAKPGEGRVGSSDSDSRGFLKSPSRSDDDAREDDDDFW